jgi:uncharacterized protein YfaS (alpha-2-macroglobulin family)
VDILRSRFDLIKKRIKVLYVVHRKLVILTSLFLALVVVNAFSGNLQKSTLSRSENENLQILVLNKITPDGGVVLPEKISFYFSDPVDPHVFEHFMTISPSAEGKVVKGEQPNQLDFVPNEPFVKGTSYFVSVSAGLTSLNGKTLFGDQSATFSTVLKDNFVQFTSGSISGRVLSFPANDPVSLKLRLSENLPSANVTLYKSTQAQLLNSLLYSSVDKSEGKYKWTAEEFLKNSIDHNPSQKIESFTGTKDQEKEFDLKPGVYYIEATLGKDAVIGSSFIIVNTLGVTFRQDDKRIVLSTFDLQSGKKVSHEANVGFYNLDRAPTQLATRTYSTLESSIPFNINTRLDAIVGTINGESIFIPVRIKDSLADIQSARDLDQVKKIFLYTDRPLYKEKDTVFFRGIVRSDGDSLYSLPPSGQQVKIFLRSYREGVEDFETIVQTDAGGTFSGHFTLPEWAKDIQYLYASTDITTTEFTRDTASAYFDVKSFVKPEFEIKTTVNKEEFIRGDKAVYTISANYFDGKPYANQEVSYTFYNEEYYETEKAVYNKNFNLGSFGGMCGGGFAPFEEYYGPSIGEKKEITLDKNGQAQVTFTMPDNLSGSKKITIVALKKDKSDNEIVSAANTIFHGADYNIFFMPSSQKYDIGEEIVAPFYAESLSGARLADKELSYKLLSTSYDSNSGKTTENYINAGKVKTDSNGRGIIKHTLKGDLGNSNYLILEGEDDKGNKSEAKKYITVVKKDAPDSQYYYYAGDRIDQTYLKIASSQNNFKVGDKIMLSVESPADIDALMSLERGRIYYPNLVHLNKGHNAVEIVVGEDLSPSITVVFSFFADGKYHTEGLSLNVPAMHKLMQVAVVPDKARYKPFETAQIKITTKDADSNPVPARLSMSIVDKALLTLRKNATPPIHSSFYYFRPRSTNASSSLTWVGQFGGGGGGGGGAGGLGGQAVDTLYWNPNITTGLTGETVLPVELHGFTTTWKALVIGSTDTSLVGQGDTEFVVAK